MNRLGKYTKIRIVIMFGIQTRIDLFFFFWSVSFFSLFPKLSRMNKHRVIQIKAWKGSGALKTKGDRPKHWFSGEEQGCHLGSWDSTFRLPFAFHIENWQMVSDTSGSPILAGLRPMWRAVRNPDAGPHLESLTQQDWGGAGGTCIFNTFSRLRLLVTVTPSTPLQLPWEGMGHVPQQRHSPDQSGALHSLGLKDKIFSGIKPVSSTKMRANDDHARDVNFPYFMVTVMSSIYCWIQWDLTLTGKWGRGRTRKPTTLRWLTTELTTACLFSRLWPPGWHIEL